MLRLLGGARGAGAPTGGGGPSPGQYATDLSRLYEILFFLFLFLFLFFFFFFTVVPVPTKIPVIPLTQLAVSISVIFAKNVKYLQDQHETENPDEVSYGTPHGL